MLRNKLFLLSALALCSVVLVQCSPKTAKSTTASTGSAASTEPHYSAAQIADGKTIYTANCGKCHKLFAPEEKSLEKWNRVLPPMIKKAKLDEQQGALVRAYVMANLKS